MKTLYITAFLFAGIVCLHAQENKAVEKQNEIKAITDIKTLETKMYQKQDSKKVEKKTIQLLSEQGLAQQKSVPNQKTSNKAAITRPSNNIKDLPSAVSLETTKQAVPKD
jgi:gas vesicle protein